MPLIPKYLKTHGTSNNSTDYTPVFTDLSGHGSPSGSIGSYTPSYFGVHNPSSSAMDITVWTVDQGTSGTGASVRLNSGETFYARIAKLTVPGTVTLLGTTNTASLI